MSNFVCYYLVKSQLSDLVGVPSLIVGICLATTQCYFFYFLLTYSYNILWQIQEARGTRAPSGPNFFISMHLSGKIGQIVCWRPFPPRVGASPFWDISGSAIDIKISLQNFTFLFVSESGRCYRIFTAVKSPTICPRWNTGFIAVNSRQYLT